MSEAMRNLAADLADIDKHEPTWRISILWEDRTNYVWPDYQRWRNHLPEVAREAIRRALAAEARVAQLEAEAAEITIALTTMVCKLAAQGEPPAKAAEGGTS